MINISAKRLYWSHCKVLIISQDVAKDGIIPIIDFVIRDAEPRLTLKTLVSKEKTAKELLKQQSITTEVRAFEMDFMVEANNHLSKSIEVDVVKLVDVLSDQGIYPYLPAIRIILNNGKETANLSGIAVFKGDKFLGFLNEEDTMFFLFAINKIKGGVFILNPDKENLKDKVTLEIFENKTKVQPVYLDGRLKMKIDVITDVSLSEIDTTRNYVDVKNLNTLEKEAEAYVKNHIEATIKKVQEDYNSDIFGFGRIVMQDMPSLWKSIENEWDKIFQNLEVEVNVDLTIKDIGLTSRPIKVGDF